MSVSRVLAVAALVMTTVWPAQANADDHRHGRIEPRGGGVVVNARPRVEVRRPSVVVSPRVVVGARPYVVRPYVFSRPRYVRYARPYYVFRPRVSIGFGVWAGYPVPYPAYGYAVPYPYPVYVPSPYPAPYPQYPAQYPQYPAQAPQYPAQTPQQYPVQPPSGTVSPSAIGGVSFDFTPSNAAVYIDGQYQGEVGQFTADSQPLSLSPGRHHVEIQATGYVPMAFDVDIIAGQVIPYQGSLRRY
jgi:hypothetical protein